MTRTDTETTCEVVKIVAVDKHPNADRLEIAHFAFADGTIPDYQVVVGKGDFVVGQLAVYISDDMMVPIDLDEFAFLKTRLDYKGTTHYRIRAAKIRGQISTGLIIPHNKLWGNLGSDVSGVLGVIKYVNPLDSQDINSQKSVSKRGSSWFGRLLTRLGKYFYKPVSVPEYGVTSLRKVPDLFKDGEKVILTEKIHGCNIRFGKIGNRIYVGSHRTEKSDSRPWFLRKVFPRRQNAGFYGKDVWSTWFSRIFNSKDRLAELPSNIIFYGELFGPGIQPWTYGLRNTQVMVYDAYDIKNKRWLDHIELSVQLPWFIQLVPTIGTNNDTIFNRDSIKTLAESNTQVKDYFDVDPKHKCNDMEGIVVRSLDWSRAGKLVSDKYLTSEH